MLLTVLMICCEPVFAYERRGCRQRISSCGNLLVEIMLRKRLLQIFSVCDYIYRRDNFCEAIFVEIMLRERKIVTEYHSYNYV